MQEFIDWMNGEHKVIKLVRCMECVNFFRHFNGEELKEHYYTRKKVKRCIGCDQLKYYYKNKIQPLENMK